MGLNTTRERLLDRQRKASVATQKAAEETKTSQDAANTLLTAIDAVLDTIDERMDRVSAPSSTVMLTGTKAFTGPFYALSALEDSVIDASEGGTNITESDDSGAIQALSGELTIPKGMTIYGNFAVVELDSGKMIGYAAAGVTVSVAGT